MADPKRNSRTVSFSGGLISDVPATEADAVDMENLLPPAGGARGLVPRDGVDYLLTLSTDDTDGYVIHEVTLDDVARTKMITVSSAATGRVELMTEHTDMEGLQEVKPKGGGTLPDTEPEPPAHVLFTNTTDTGADGTTLIDVGTYSTARTSGSDFRVAVLVLPGESTGGESNRSALTENFLCVPWVNFATGQKCVSFFDRADLTDNPDGTITECRTVEFGVDADFPGPGVQTWPGLFPYAGDILFVQIKNSLFKVVITASGTLAKTTVTDALVDTGTYEIPGPFGINSDMTLVDASGYLWLNTAVSSPFSRRILRVDPVDGTTAVAEMPADLNYAASSDGGVYGFWSGVMKKLNPADMTTATVTITNAGTSPVFVSNRICGHMRSGITATRSGVLHGDDIYMFNPDTNTRTDSNLFTPPDYFDIFTYNAANYVLFGKTYDYLGAQYTVDGFYTLPIDGSAASTMTAMGYTYPDWQSIDYIQDPFGYWLTNVQGTRL